MRARIQRWRNSLAVRIPKPFVAEAGLEQQSEVDVAVVGGALVITPSPSPALDELLARVTDENLHGEIDLGLPWDARSGRNPWPTSPTAVTSSESPSTPRPIKSR
jgi:antitoxin MazE